MIVAEIVVNRIYFGSDRGRWCCMRGVYVISQVSRLGPSFINIISLKHALDMKTMPHKLKYNPKSRTPNASNQPDSRPRHTFNTYPHSSASSPSPTSQTQCKASIERKIPHQSHPFIVTAKSRNTLGRYLCKTLIEGKDLATCSSTIVVHSSPIILSSASSRRRGITWEMSSVGRVELDVE